MLTIRNDLFPEELYGLLIVVTRGLQNGQLTLMQIEPFGKLVVELQIEHFVDTSFLFFFIKVKAFKFEPTLVMSYS